MQRREGSAETVPRVCLAVSCISSGSNDRPAGLLGGAVLLSELIYRLVNSKLVAGGHLTQA